MANADHMLLRPCTCVLKTFAASASPERRVWKEARQHHERCQTKSHNFFRSSPNYGCYKPSLVFFCSGASRHHHTVLAVLAEQTGSHGLAATATQARRCFSRWERRDGSAELPVAPSPGALCTAGPPSQTSRPRPALLGPCPAHTRSGKVLAEWEGARLGRGPFPWAAGQLGVTGTAPAQCH